MSFLPIPRLVATASLALVACGLHAAPISIRPEETTAPVLLMEEVTSRQDASLPESENRLTPIASASHWLSHEGFSQWLEPLKNGFAFQPSDEGAYLTTREVKGAAFDALPLVSGMLTTEVLSLAIDGREVTPGSQLARLFRTPIPSNALALQEGNTIHFSLGSDPLPGVSPANPQASTCALLVVGLASVLFFRRRAASH